MLVKFEKSLEKIEEILRYSFENRLLLMEAIVHKSYASHFHLDFHYERLEFLGDSVLQLYISELLFAREFKDPGFLTRLRARLVSREVLCEIIRDFSLEPFLYVHQSLRKKDGSIYGDFLGDFFESILAAIYLDGGNFASNQFLDGVYQNYEEWIELTDFKSRLQEICLKFAKELPVYDTIPIDSEYEARILLCGRVLSCGRGKRKKQAQQMAAREAILALEEGE